MPSTWEEKIGNNLSLYGMLQYPLVLPLMFVQATRTALRYTHPHNPVARRSLSTIKTFHAGNMSLGQSKVLRSEPLSDGDAKWVGLRAIYWQDPSGKERKWESADRRTRKGDADAVAICCIVQRPSSEPHILLVSQFRPPVNATVVEMPAGLIDEGEEGIEGAKTAAIRELREETGYGDRDGAKMDVKLVSNIMVNDPVRVYDTPSFPSLLLNPGMACSTSLHAGYVRSQHAAVRGSNRSGRRRTRTGRRT